MSDDTGFRFPVARHYRKLTVVVPVYNERNTVAEIIRRVRMTDLPLELEVIVVDDGSDDGTRDVIGTLEDSTVRVINHESNRGKGSAVRTGIGAATGDVVVIQDADLEYDPDDWAVMLAPMLKGKCRVVYGSRFTGERSNMSFAHWMGNKVLSLTTNVLYNSTLTDMETCYKMFEREVVQGLRLEAAGFEIEPEITARLLRSGERIIEVPISYAGRDFHAGKKITWRDGFAALWTLVRLRVTSP